MSGTASRQIRRVAVLGAGTMGARVAAHIANAGVPVVLLDFLPPGATVEAGKAARSKVSLAALDSLKTVRPAAFYSIEFARLVTVGNFDDDLALIAECDWVIEAVADNLKIKRALFKQVEKYRRLGSILTTNTNSIPIASIAEGLSAEARLHFMGTHFFSPPRYMRLLELIPTSETEPEDLAVVARFCDLRLGKTPVNAHDTPNLIANRIGTFSMGNTMRLMRAQGLSIEEVDTLTGSALGWPETGTFRLGDLIGVDVLANVAANFAAKAAKIHDERQDVTLPSFVAKMVDNQWFGDKAGQGFYKKEAGDEAGRSVHLVLDWRTLEYGPSTRPKFPALELAKNLEHTGKRIALLLHADPGRDRTAAFYWPLLTELFTYTANRIPEIADNAVAIDTAMRTGFNWELGPFEMMDAVGVRTTTKKMQSLGLPVAANVMKLLAVGESWYRDDPHMPARRQFFDPVSGAYHPVPVPEGVMTLAASKRAHGVVKRNAGASVIDLGHGVAAIELHSKRNALGDDIVTLITEALKPASQQVADFEAFVITGDSANFSAGANLSQLLLTIQGEEWDEVELAVRALQNMTQVIKFCPRPVVVAPFGMCLGVGAEISLHAASRQPHAELYMGLVEADVGLIPAGGGCKEMLLRAVEAGSSIRSDARESVEIFDALKKSFETIDKATVSTSAVQARELGFLRSGDVVTVNRDRLLADAKARALALAHAGYMAPTARGNVPAPGGNTLATLNPAVWTMREGQYLSEHDTKVATWLAYVLSGGRVTPGTPVSEQYLLDLEREAFLSLCGEKKTQERIAFTLKTGKPLRN